MPDNIRNSKILTGNHLGMLANVETIPEPNPGLLTTLPGDTNLNGGSKQENLHTYAAKLLDENKVTEAWQVLLNDDKNQ